MVDAKQLKAEIRQSVLLKRIRSSATPALADITTLCNMIEGAKRLILSPTMLNWGWNIESKHYGYYVAGEYVGQTLEDAMLAADRREDIA